MDQNMNAPHMPQMQVDLTHASDVVCAKCENKVFQLGCFIKKLSEVTSPTGKEMIVPIQTLQCTGCRHVNDEFLPKDLKGVHVKK
jgi:hypothetical protein